jgi:hypothetical protein
MGPRDMFCLRYIILNTLHKGDDDDDDDNNNNNNNNNNVVLFTCWLETICASYKAGLNAPRRNIKLKNNTYTAPGTKQISCWNNSPISPHRIRLHPNLHAIADGANVAS